jgi:hypothetical protein
MPLPKRYPRSNCHTERLERRTLLAFAAAGSEFRVNSITLGVQSDPAIAVDGDGDFVVAYTVQDVGFNRNIYIQCYNGGGVTIGGETRVNTTTVDVQQFPAIAMDAQGDFVVAWQSQNQDGSGSGVYAQRYNAAGVPQGSEVRVNSFTTGQQQSPAIAMDTVGNFVIAWQSDDQDGSGAGVYAQRFDASGARRGDEFAVNTLTNDQQQAPSVAMDGSGDFVIAWQSGTGNAYGIVARRYSAAGVARGDEFAVNTYTPDNQLGASVAASPAGDFVIAWNSVSQDGSGTGVYAQRYDAAGAPQGAEFRVNTFVFSNEHLPSISMDGAGNFLVAWESAFQDGSSYGVYAQRFSAAGAAQGAEFRVNTTTANAQFRAAVALERDGDAVVARQSDLQDGSSLGVYAQRYDETTDAAGPMISGLFIGGKAVPAHSVQPGPISQFVVAFSENVIDSGTFGANSVTNVNNWRVALDTVSVVLSSVSYGFNAAANRYEATLNLAGALTSGNLQIVATGNIRDLANNPLVDNQDGNVGGDSVGFSIAPFAPHGGEIRTNTFTLNSQHDATVASNADGSFVVAWTSEDQDISGSGIFAQRYDSAGRRLGTELHVNTYTTDTQFAPAVAIDATGDFVIAWTSYGQDGYDSGIYAQRFNAAGEPQGEEFRVNSTVFEHQRYPAVAMDATGDFVVAWESYGQDGSFYGVFAQRYNALGEAQGFEIRVNTSTFGNQRGATVAMDSDGDFVVGWQSAAQDGSGYGVYARRYNAGGIAQGGEFRVNTTTAGNQQIPAVAIDSSGNFLVSWESYGQDGSFYGVYAQRYSAAGAPLGGEFRVNSTTSAIQRAPAVSMDGGGDFVVTWQSFGQDQSFYGVYAQRYSPAGSVVGTELKVNATTVGNQWFPAVAMDSSGDFVVAWETSGQYGSSDGDGVYAQRYSVGAAPTVVELSDFPDPAPGGTLALTATGVSDDVGVSQIRFYRETNGIPHLQFGPGGDTLVGTDVNGGDGWSLLLPLAGVPNGTYGYYAQPVDTEGLFGAPASAVNTVGAPDPLAAQSASLEYQTRQAISFNFNNALNPFSVSAGDLTALNLTTGATPVAADVILSNNNFTATWVFSRPEIPIGNGNYRFILPSGSLTDVNGSSLLNPFQFSGPNVFFLGGDANRDRKVDIIDLGTVATHWFQSNLTFSQGNFDYSSDGVVKVTDLGILASAWQQVLAPPGGSFAPESTRGRSPVPRIVTEII